MSPRPLKITAAMLVSTALAFVQVAQACNTGSSGGSHTGGHSGGHPTPISCPQGGGVTINKPVTINKSVNVYKPVTIDKSINIYKPVTIDKSVNIDKSINIDKSLFANVQALLDSAHVASSGNGTVITDAAHDQITLAGLTPDQIKAHPEVFHLI